MTRFVLPGLWIFFVFWGGCSHSPEIQSATPPSAQAVVPLTSTQSGAWWSIRFRMTWTTDEAPNWTVDALLADAVIEPVLMRYHHDIVSWRFHRRANNDGAGRQFSFIFYGHPTVAAQIFDDVVSDPLLQALISRKTLTTVVMDDVSTPRHRHIEDNSDPHWPVALQKAWPHYIMGASAMWLALINEFAQTSSVPISDTDALLTHYAAVHQSVVEIWEENGQHAFFHHLSAVFGYEPLVIRHKVRF